MCNYFAYQRPPLLFSDFIEMPVVEDKPKIQIMKRNSEANNSENSSAIKIGEKVAVNEEKSRREREQEYLKARASIFGGPEETIDHFQPIKHVSNPALHSTSLKSNIFDSITIPSIPKPVKPAVTEIQETADDLYKLIYVYEDCSYDGVKLTELPVLKHILEFKKVPDNPEAFLKGFSKSHNCNIRFIAPFTWLAVFKTANDAQRVLLQSGNLLLWTPKYSEIK